MEKKDDEGVEEKGRKGINYKCQNKPKQMGKAKSWMSSRGTKEVERMGTLQVVRIQGKIATQFRKSMERGREGKGKKNGTTKKRTSTLRQSEEQTNKQINNGLGIKRIKKKIQSTQQVEVRGSKLRKRFVEKPCRHCYIIKSSYKCTGSKGIWGTKVEKI